MSDFNDNPNRVSLDFDTNTIVADAHDKAFHSADELVVQQKENFVAEQKDAFAVQQKDEFVAQQKDEFVAQQKDEFAVQQKDEFVALQKDEFVALQKDELTDVADGVRRNDFTVGLDIAETEIASCSTKIDVEVVDSNAACNDRVIASETDFKAVDSCHISKAENVYSGNIGTESNLDNLSVGDGSSCAKINLNVDLDAEKVKESISEKTTGFEGWDSDVKSQIQTYFTLLESDDMDKTKVLDTNFPTEVTREADINVVESDDIVKVQFESCINEGFTVSFVDHFIEGETGEKNVDLTVKSSNDTNTYSDATKKGKVSFKIDDSDKANKAKEASTSQETNAKKARLTPKMLNRMKKLLLQKSYNDGNDEFYIGDLIDVVEGELMDLPQNRKVSRKQETSINHLTKTKIRSINKQRLNICLNMQVLSSSINTEFENMGEIILNLRQACSDFNVEFNQPLTPIGEPNAASLRMDELFVKTKAYLPLLQDCFKEVKHCSRLFVRADRTLTDNLDNTIQMYFGDKLKAKHLPRVHYTEVLKIFKNSNRQHCHLAIDANEMDNTSDTLLDKDNN